MVKKYVKTTRGLPELSQNSEVLGFFDMPWRQLCQFSA